MKKKIFPLLILLLLTLLPATLFTIPPTSAVMKTPPTPPNGETPENFPQADAPAISLPYNWTAFWSRIDEVISWKATPKDEDLQIIKEYPEPDICKISLNLTASLPSVYTITFKIDQQFLQWEVIDNSSIKLQYNTHWLIFNFSDVEDMRLQHSHSTTGKLFVFHIQKQMKQGENLFVDPTLIAGGVEGEHYYQRHVWYAANRWWLFYSDGTNAKYNSSADGETGWVGGTLYAGVQYTQRIDAHYNGSHFFITVSLTDQFFRMGDPNSDGTWSWEAGWQNLGRYGEAYITEPAVSADSDGYPWVVITKEDPSGWIKVEKSSTRDGTWSTASGFPVTLFGGAGKDPEGCLAPLNNTAMYVIWTPKDEGAQNIALQGRLWDGDSWETEETVTSTTASNYRFNILSVNSTVYVTYRDGSTGNAYFTSKEWGGEWMKNPTFTGTSSDGYIFTGPNSNYTAIWESTTGDVVLDNIDGSYIGQSKSDDDYYVSRSYVFFDTSSIPDNVDIQTATLSLYGEEDGSTVNFNITVQNGQPTYPHDPIVAGDYNKAHYSGVGGYFDTSGFTIAGYNEVTLNSTGISWINKTGTTKFCLRSSREIAGTTPGASSEYVWIETFEETGKEPKLEILYSTGVFDISGTTIINTPSIIRRENSELWVLWGDSNKKIWMRYFNGEQWFDKRHVATEPVYSGGEACFEVTSAAWPDCGLLFYGSLYFDVFNMFEDWYVEITDPEGCGLWCFAEEKYYHFKANYSNLEGYEMFDTSTITFTDGEVWITPMYDHITEEWIIYEGDESEYGASDKINIQDGTVSYTTYRAIVTFEIYFESKILDALDIDIYMWSNFTDDTEVGYVLPSSNVDYFNIYNLGGHSELSSSDSGDAGRLPGGDVFELYAYNNSWVESTVIFRHLQHIRLLPIISYTNEFELTNFTIKYSVDYCTEADDWIEGWTIEIKNPAQVIWFIKNNDNVYHNWTVNLYNRGELVHSTQMYSYLWTDEGWYNTSIRLWIDLWFNKENASSTFGGRVNSYRYPMKNGASIWLRWLYGNDWGIDEEKKKQSMIFETLKDGSNDTLHTQQIKLVKIKCNVTSYFDGTKEVSVRVSDYDVFDLTFGREPFTGVQTPAFRETLIPRMPQGGIFGMIWSAIINLGNELGKIFGPTILGFWLVFVGFLDTIFGWLGWQGGFTQIINWIIDFITFIGTGLSTLVTMLTSLYEIVTGPLVLFLVHVGNMITNTISVISGMIYWLNPANWIQSITGQPLTPEMIADFQELFVNVMTIVGILIPVWEIVRMEKYGFQILFQDINTIFDLFTFFIGIFVKVAQLFIRFVSSLIESIPIIE